MGILSLPPLARLLAGYIDMMITELDDVYAESALSSVVGNDAKSVQVGVTSSVRSVGKLFSSLFTSVYTTEDTPPPPPPPPPPLPPPSPPKHADSNDFDLGINDEYISEHIMNYWNDDSKAKRKSSKSSNSDNSHEQESLSTAREKLKYAVVKRKAKVREGVEFEKVSSPGGSQSKAAEKVGTLSEGAVVVILDNDVATDGTRRSKVQSCQSFPSICLPLIYFFYSGSWVSSE